MHDSLQQALYTLASHHAVAGALAVVCAAYLVYVMAVAWLALLVWRRARLTVALVVRVVVMILLAYLAAKILGGIVVDQRPYLAEHVRPLTAIARDNGFPSDHTLLAAVMAASLWWIERRWLAAFALATLLVALGRLAIGAHHTLDVAGSMLVVLVATLIVTALPLPAGWSRPLLAPESSAIGARSSR